MLKTIRRQPEIMFIIMFVFLISICSCRGRVRGPGSSLFFGKQVKIHRKFYQITEKNNVNIEAYHKYGHQPGSYWIPGTSIYIRMNPDLSKFAGLEMVNILSGPILSYFITGPYVVRKKIEYMKEVNRKLCTTMSENNRMKISDHNRDLYEYIKDVLKTETNCKFMGESNVDIVVDSQIYLEGTTEATFFDVQSTILIEPKDESMPYRIIFCYFSEFFPLSEWANNNWSKVSLYTEKAIKEHKLLIQAAFQRNIETIVENIGKTRDICNVYFNRYYAILYTRPKGVKLKYDYHMNCN